MNKHCVIIFEDISEMSFNIEEFKKSIIEKDIGNYFMLWFEYSRHGAVTPDDQEYANIIVYDHVRSGHLKMTVVESNYDQEGEELDPFIVPFENIIDCITPDGDTDLFNDEGIEVKRSDIYVEFQRIPTIEEYKKLKSSILILLFNLKKQNFLIVSFSLALSTFIIVFS